MPACEAYILSPELIQSWHLINWTQQILQPCRLQNSSESTTNPILAFDQLDSANSAALSPANIAQVPIQTRLIRRHATFFIIGVITKNQHSKSFVGPNVQTTMSSHQIQSGNRLHHLKNSLAMIVSHTTLINKRVS
jgi:hypothetical protein